MSSGTADTAATGSALSLGSSPRVWTFLPLHGKHGEGKFAFVDAADVDWMSEHRWNVNQKGYVWRGVQPGGCAGRFQTIYLHREVMGFEDGDGRKTDHINRDKFDNRRHNLRETTIALNAQNVEGHGRSSRFRNVYRTSYAPKPWMANAGLDGKTHYIGIFATEDEAAEAASAWRAEHMPFSEDARKEAS